MRTTFTFVSDPGHAWLIVSPADLDGLGLSEADFTPYGYRLGDQIALEEDLDAGTFLNAYRAKFGRSPTICEQVVPHGDAPLRSWPRYGHRR